MKIFTLFFVFGLMATAMAAPSSLEDRVKAAYILNFARYTIWPSEVFPDAHAPLVVCVLGSDIFRTTLQKTVSGIKVDSRFFEVRELKEPFSSPNQCHIVFIDRSYMQKEFGLLTSLKQKPILSISDDESFFEKGGIISFVVYEETIQFNVNLLAADQAGLKLSSRMLALAKKVIKESRN